jgi:hypothetical protein
MLLVLALVDNNPYGSPPCKCPDVTPINYNSGQGSTCVANCPTGLIADYPPSYGSASYSFTMKECLCPDKTYPTNGVCGSSNYCSPNISPTATNPCTCNPFGGAYFSSNTCTCPTNSGQTYTKESGCTGSTSTTTCSSPYIKDPAFPQSCKCPDGTPYELGSTCVATCPSGLIPSTSPGGPYSSTKQVCKCSDSTYPNAQGTCSTTQCPTPFIPNLYGNTPCKCPESLPYIYQSTCVATCPPGLQVTGPSGQSTQPTCLCPGGSFPDGNGNCGGICQVGQVSSSTNPCTCAAPGYITGPNTSCICPTGYSKAYSDQGCGSVESTGGG